MVDKVKQAILSFPVEKLSDLTFEQLFNDCYHETELSSMEKCSHFSKRMTNAFEACHNFCYIVMCSLSLSPSLSFNVEKTSHEKRWTINFDNYRSSFFFFCFFLSSTVLFVH